MPTLAEGVDELGDACRLAGLVLGVVVGVVRPADGRVRHAHRLEGALPEAIQAHELGLQQPQKLA